MDMWKEVKCPECGERYEAGEGVAFERPLCVCVFEEIRQTVVLQAGAAGYRNAGGERMTLEVKRAPTCRGVCRLCGKPIRKGALRVDFQAHAPRWGVNELYHADCVKALIAQMKKQEVRK
jgi:hypothetical protein